MFFYGFVLLAFALFLGLPFPGALFVFFAPIVAFTGGCVVVSSVNTKRCRVNRNEPNNESRNESAREEDCADGRGEDIGSMLVVKQWSIGGRSLTGGGIMEMEIFMKMKVMRDDTDEREERFKKEERLKREEMSRKCLIPEDEILRGEVMDEDDDE
ncbi:hypothetical protein LWI28_013009 [Acer negundo]|uniref:Uncharacterized protein n=1 Tax=Acer negundo TaxID=4023 RepID=A0AAD5JKI1_ACENE|nr:hypothetical protein LWI28_013009 [Acer negundo]